MTLNIVLKNGIQFQWLKLKHAIPNKWKTSNKLSSVNASDFLVQDHHLIKGARNLALRKLRPA